VAPGEGDGLQALRGAHGGGQLPGGGLMLPHRPQHVRPQPLHLRRYQRRPPPRPSLVPWARTPEGGQPLGLVLATLINDNTLI